VARTDQRGGPQTRARIAEVASGLFVEHGFDAVTVAAVAKAAGVSSVTVFKHFPRKEDLFLDRAADAEDLLRSAIRDRAPGTDAVAALRELTLRLLDERHPLCGLNDRSEPFFRTVAGSPALLARARELAADLQQTLTGELGEAAELLAAFFVAGYATVLVAAARAVLAGAEPDTLAAAQRGRLERLFDALRGGVPSP
jgi:AcrR family transcriptional regulator